MATFADIIARSSTAELISEDTLNNLLVALRLAEEPGRFNKEQYAKLSEADTEHFLRYFDLHEGINRQDFEKSPLYIHGFRSTSPICTEVLPNSMITSVQNYAGRNYKYRYHLAPFRAFINFNFNSPNISNVWGKTVSILQESGLKGLGGLFLFETYGDWANIFTAYYKANYGSSKLTFFVFRDDWYPSVYNEETGVHEKEQKNTENTFHEFNFMDMYNFTKTVLSVGDVPSAVAVYQGQFCDLVVVPVALWRMIPEGKSRSESKDILKAILHKITSAIAAKFNTPEGKRQKIKDNVNASLTDYYTNGVQQKEQQVTQAIIHRDNSRQAYVQAANQANLLTMELEGMRNSSERIDEIRNRVENEMEEVFKIDKVKNIRYNAVGRMLSIDTHFLYFLNPDTEVLHQLGEMTINVNMVDFGFTFQNHTMKYNGAFDHPHIHKTQICYGNWGIGMPELLMEGRIGVFVDLTLAFLETCNPKDDWGRSAIYWPIKDESKALAGWAELKSSRNRDYIMPLVKEPERPMTDEQLLDFVERHGIQVQQVDKPVEKKGKKKVADAVDATAVEQLMRQSYFTLNARDQTRYRQLRPEQTFFTVATPPAAQAYPATAAQIAPTWETLLPERVETPPAPEAVWDFGDALRDDDDLIEGTGTNNNF